MPRPATLWVPGLLLLLYLVLLVPAFSGWGFATESSGGSFWGFNRTSVYTSEPSVREGSIGGPSRRGGSFGGK